MNTVKYEIRLVTRAALALLTLALTLPAATASAATERPSNEVQRGIERATAEATEQVAAEKAGPVETLEAIHEEMNDLLEPAAAANAALAALEIENSAVGSSDLAVKVEEKPDQYILHVTGTGIPGAAVDVAVDGRFVTVSSEQVRDVERTEANGDVVVRETAASEAGRTVELSQPVDGSRMSTSSGDGEFTIVLPKTHGDEK